MFGQREQQYARIKILPCPDTNQFQRFGNAITSDGVLNLRGARFSSDFSPIDPVCKCICCRSTGDNDGLSVTKALIYSIANKETAGAHL